MYIRQVQPNEAHLVAGVLTAAAVALVDKGEVLWDLAEVTQAAVDGHVRAGMYYAAFDDEGPVGVFRFQLEDRYFWPEIPEGSSAFVHKLAVCPHKQGRDLAQVLLRHACDLTRELGLQFLRLDCVSARPRLRAMYERFGFHHHSQKTLGDRTFDRFEFKVVKADASHADQRGQAPA